MVHGHTFDPSLLQFQYELNLRFELFVTVCYNPHIYMITDTYIIVCYNPHIYIHVVDR